MSFAHDDHNESPPAPRDDDNASWDNPKHVAYVENIERGLRYDEDDEWVAKEYLGGLAFDNGQTVEEFCNMKVHYVWGEIFNRDPSKVVKTGFTRW